MVVFCYPWRQVINSPCLGPPLHPRTTAACGLMPFFTEIYGFPSPAGAAQAGSDGMVGKRGVHLLLKKKGWATEWETGLLFICLPVVSQPKQTLSILSSGSRTFLCSFLPLCVFNSLFPPLLSAEGFLTLAQSVLF